MLVKKLAPEPILSSLSDGHRIGRSGACVSERVASAAFESMKQGRVRQILDSCNLTEREFSSLIGAKYSASLCSPGEAVGSIAAQFVSHPGPMKHVSSSRFFLTQMS